MILWSGWPFLVRGCKSFRTMNLNMFSLIGIEAVTGKGVKGIVDGRAVALGNAEDARRPRSRSVRPPARPTPAATRGRR